MRRNKIIESTIIQAKDNFRRSLEFFWPAYESNGFAERNITFQFAHAFANRPCACVFMEVPYFNKKSKVHDLHIDCYVFDQQIGIFIESKRLYSIEKAESIIKDINKMNQENISYIINNLHEGNIPNTVYTLILAESWNQGISKWWVEGENGKIKWNEKDFPENMIYSACEVGNETDSSLTWLYGYRRLSLED